MCQLNFEGKISARGTHEKLTVALAWQNSKLKQVAAGTVSNIPSAGAPLMNDRLKKLFCIE